MVCRFDVSLIFQLIVSSVNSTLKELGDVLFCGHIASNPALHRNLEYFLEAAHLSIWAKYQPEKICW